MAIIDDWVGGSGQGQHRLGEAGFTPAVLGPSRPGPWPSPGLGGRNTGWKVLPA